MNKYTGLLAAIVTIVFCVSSPATAGDDSYTPVDGEPCKVFFETELHKDGLRKSKAANSISDFGGIPETKRYCREL